MGESNKESKKSEAVNEIYYETHRRRREKRPRERERQDNVLSQRVNDGKEEKEIVEAAKSKKELNEQESEFRKRLMSAGRIV